jgi:geranylgeranyl reductase family protein
MEKATCDVLIIGAGPAGTTAAFALASRGFKVALLDRRQFPRPKLCGGLLTWKTMQVLERVFRTSPRTLAARGMILHATREYMLAGRGRRAVRRTLDYPFHLVDRQAYDHFWLQQAVSAGAEFHPNSPVTAFDLRRREAITANGEKWTGRFIIGADGVNSRIRRALAQAGRIADPARSERATALECFVPRQEGSFPHCPAIYYGYVPWGYGWSFPYPHHQVLGIAVLKHRTGFRLKDGFRDFIASQGAPASGALRIQAHGLPYGNYLKNPGYANVLLVGDAAGLADPFLGEGIYYAHRSAQLAAAAVIESRAHPEAAAGRYRDGFRRTLYPELRYARAGRQILFSLPPHFYFPLAAALLRLMPKLCEETIQGQRSFRWFQRKETPAGVG